MPESSLDVKLHKHLMDKHTKTDKQHDDERKRCRKRRKSSTISSSFLNLFSSLAVPEVDSTDTKAQKVRKENLVQAELSVRKTMKKLRTNAWFSNVLTCERVTWVWWNSFLLHRQVSEEGQISKLKRINSILIHKSPSPGFKQPSRSCVVQIEIKRSRHVGASAVCAWGSR